VLDILEEDFPYSVGDATHYGVVIKIPPPIAPFNEGVDQSVIVKLNPDSLAMRPEQSVFPQPPSSYNKIQFFPVLVDTFGYLGDRRPELTRFCQPRISRLRISLTS
jgi:hypothetical protein